MVDYIERDGDWVLRPPGYLHRARMCALILRADSGTLTRTVCDRFLRGPSGSKITATPLGFVILLCADIESGYSENKVDRKRGILRERDVGFFVPVRLHTPKGSHFTTLLPYLYVDDFAAVIIGREIFGFPKILVDVNFCHDPVFCDVQGQVSARLDASSPVLKRQILTVRELEGARVQSVPAADDDVQAATLGMTAALATEGLIGNPFAFTSIPMTFLKQFRHADDPDKACHQSIVSADAGVTGVRRPRVHHDAFEVEIPEYEGLCIKQNLGLENAIGGTKFRPRLAFTAELNFRLPSGRTLWTA